MTEQAFMEELIRGGDNGPIRELGAALLREPLGNGQMVYFWGDQGVGKTWMLKALARELEERHPGLRVHYVTSSDLMANQIWAILYGTLDRFRRELMEADVLMVEDIFFIADKQTTRQELFRLMEGMMNGGKTIILSARRPPWEFPDGPLGELMRNAQVREVHRPDASGRMAIARGVAAQMEVPLTEELLELVVRDLDTPWRISGMVKRIAVLHRTGQISLTREAVEQLLRRAVPADNAGL